MDRRFPFSYGSHILARLAHLTYPYRFPPSSALRTSRTLHHRHRARAPRQGQRQPRRTPLRRRVLARASAAAERGVHDCGIIRAAVCGTFCDGEVSRRGGEFVYGAAGLHRHRLRPRQVRLLSLDEAHANSNLCFDACSMSALLLSSFHTILVSYHLEISIYIQRLAVAGEAARVRRHSIYHRH